MGFRDSCAMKRRLGLEDAMPVRVYDGIRSECHLAGLCGLQRMRCVADTCCLKLYKITKLSLSA
jgi:hypothetical protein